MQTVLIVIQLLVSIALVIVVLLQKSEGGALGMGGSGGGLGGLFSPRGAGDALTRTTAILAVAFFVTSLALTLLSLHGRPQQASILDSQPIGTAKPALPAQPAKQPAGPKAPAVPAPH
ncbi:MAG: preprotein translocase subunit SecG [Proteobacteria bacterium]|jgi:preprotein translocase subunit SecG|nr:preprotein translocase subunit SecG [Pseudomonadota bacterium]